MGETTAQGRLGLDDKALGRMPDVPISALGVIKAADRTSAKIVTILAGSSMLRGKQTASYQPSRTSLRPVLKGRFGLAVKASNYKPGDREF